MGLERVCSKTVVTIAPDATALEAAQTMYSKHVGCVVVVEGFRPIGILTDRDIVLRVVAGEKQPAKTAIREIMTPNPTMVNVNYDLLDAVRLMRDRGVRRLPVVDEHRRLVGILTMDDVFRNLGAEIADLSGALQREFGQEAAAAVAS